MFIGEDDELLELTRLPMEAIQPPDHHPIHGTFPDVAQQSLVFRPGFASVERAPVVVDVDARHLPFAPRGLGSTIILLGAARRDARRKDRVICGSRWLRSAALRFARLQY